MLALDVVRFYGSRKHALDEKLYVGSVIKSTKHAEVGV